MNKAYCFRIYPNDQQMILMAKTFGCCRFLYNQMLSDKIEEYQKNGKMLKNTPAMYKKTYSWLKEVDSLSLANVQLHLEKAYKNFFRDTKVGFPKFKSKHKGKRSYTTNLVNGNIILDDTGLKLPKIGYVKIRQHREIPKEYQLKSVTVTQECSGKYYVSILFAYENQVSENSTTFAAIPEQEMSLGIDFAMHGLAVFSDGTKADYPMFYKDAEKKLSREQRKLSRCRRGSSNYAKQRLKVARCHEKVKNQRKDYQHKLGRKIAEHYEVVCIEDLDLKTMSQNMHFGKGVMDNGYGMFINMLTYKMQDKGKKLIKIDRFYPSSKTCSCCGKIKSDLTLTDRIYHCTCGNHMDRDINAAVNIKNEGIRILKDSRNCA